MDGHLGWLLFIFVVFLGFGGFFSASESALTSMNVIRIRSRAEEGDKRAKSLLFLSDRFDKTLSTLLIGNNVTHIAAATVATLIATRIFPADLVTVLSTLITTSIVFLFSEMIPKTFANDRSEEFALFAAPAVVFLTKVLSPFSKVLMKISGLITGLFKKNEQPSISEDELIDIIDTIEDQGVVDEDQSDLMKSALEFDDTSAADVMTMRGDVEAIDISLSVKEIADIVIASNHTRIPVYRGDLDHVVGILHNRRFLKAYLHNPRVSVKSLLYEPFFVPPEAKIDDLLAVMRQHRFYLAVVRSDAKKTLGVVTIEDFLEELVGEIWDEDDTYDENCIKLGGNRFGINPRLTVKDAFARIGVSINTPAAARQSVGSWIHQYYQRTRHTLPEEGDSFRYLNVDVEVEAMKNDRVTEVVLHLLESEPQSVSEGGDR